MSLLVHSRLSARLISDFTSTSLYGVQIEQLFSSGFSLHAEEASDHFNRAAAEALQEQQKAADSHPAALPSSGDPPLDWSIKSAVRFSSPEPFAIAEDAMTVNAGTGNCLSRENCCMLANGRKTRKIATCFTRAV